MKYKLRSIEAMRFYEFVEYGKEHSDNIVNGVPWSFDFYGHPVSHENDTCYCICLPTGIAHFTSNDMLIIDNNGAIYPMNKTMFDMKYDLVR